MMLDYVDTVFAFAVVMLLLSLVITTFVQLVVVGLSLRHRNLIWGVTKVLERSPVLRRHATEITNKALAHPAICASRRKAAVVGSEELITVLRELASDSDNTLTQDTKKALQDAFKEAIPPESKHHANQLSEEFKKLFPTEAIKMEQVVGLFKEKSTKLAGDLDKWFDTVMSRATDRFAVHTRWWTVVFSVILAIALQIDSLDLIRRLSTDTEIRASLASMADQALERADATLLAESVAVGALEAVRKAFPDITPFEIPAELRTRAQGSGWLNKQFNQHEKLEEMQTLYFKEFDAAARERLGNLGDEMLDLRSELQKSGLIFLPKTWAEYQRRWAEWDGHFLGVLMSALLLSLGAPFWFNALRTMASLRPVLAGKTDPSKK